MNLKTENTPFFSIVIPTYNRGYLIEHTINSILKSKNKDFEIIIVDDGSTDNTEHVVKKFLDTNIFYYGKKNEERGAARNYGTRLARGKYINFFDSDDLMYANHFSEAFKFINSRNNPEWFHLAYDYKHPDGKLISKNLLDEKAPQILYFDNILSCCGTFVRRDIALENPFDENRVLASSEDWELWIRLNSKYKLQFSNCVTTSVIAHEQRSLFQINSEKLIPRDLYLIECIEQNKRVRIQYKNKFKKFKADRFTFFMLKLAEEGKKKEVVSWALKSLKIYPMVIFSKRFLASLKNVILK